MTKFDNKTPIFIGIIIALALGAALVSIIMMDRTGREGSGLGKEFEYDLAELRKIDPSLVLYEEVQGKIVTGLKNSVGVAVGNNDDIYVTGDNSIIHYDKGGNIIRTIRLTQTPRCVAIDDGKVFVGMKNYVEVYDGNGTRKTSWQSLGPNAVLTSIAVGKNEVFVADAGNRVVLRYDKSGKLLNRIGEKDPTRNIPGFVVSSPYFDLALAADGLLRVVNPGKHRIEAFTAKGDLEFWWGEFSSGIEGFCGCCNPVHIALLNNDEGFVTCEKGLTRIKIYDADGKFVGVVAGANDFSRHDSICALKGANGTNIGFDVAVDSQDRILVLDPFTGEVRIFTKKSK